MADTSHVDGRPTRMRRWSPPRARWSALLRYGALWGWGLVRYTAWRAWATVSGRKTLPAIAARIRAQFADMGPVGALVGRQLAMRVDVGGLHLSLELATLRDEAPPLDPAVAARCVEAATGRPLGETLRLGEVLSSDAVSCTWAAELVDGTPVTVRVRRPGIEGELQAAFTMLAAVTRLFELAALLEPGLYESMAHEFENVLRDDLDFVWCGRLQRVFRDRVERDRLRGVTAPRVIPELLREDLIVAERLAGVPLSAVVSAVERRDTSALASLAAQGIEPAALGRQILLLSWWEQLEAMFFTAEPDVDRFLVLPGGTLCLTRMEDCDIVPRRVRRLLREALVRLSEDDLSAASDALVRTLAPLPRVDVHELRRKLEVRLSDALHRTRNPEAPWMWRTTLGLWLALFDTTAELGVPVRLGLSRAVRAEMTSSLLAGRLWPEIDLWSALDEHRRRSQRRILRAGVRRARISARVQGRAARAVRYLAAREGARRSLLLLDALVDTPPVRTHAVQGKGAYVVAVGMRASFAVAGFTLGLVGAMVAVTGRPVLEVTTQVVSHPGWALPVLVAALLVTRVILFRLDDLDPGR